MSPFLCTDLKFGIDFFVKFGVPDKAKVCTLQLA
jgi:hypothetical protein